MRDLDITRLCAEAMGWKLEEYTKGFRCRDADGFVAAVIPDKGIATFSNRYDPLHDDAQAMALVKKLGLDIHFRADMNGWYVGGRLHEGLFIHADLNRAICQCVAEIEASK